MHPEASITLQSLTTADRKAVIDIYNYFVETSPAAYPAEKVPYTFFDYFLNLIGDFPAVTLKDAENRIIGFAFLHPYRPLDTFAETAEITYFILPDYTNTGLGSKLLTHLEKEGRNHGISKLLASISSLNQQSLNFHRKHGFTECGRFPEIGRKFGSPFDVVWMIKNI